MPCRTKQVPFVSFVLLGQVYSLGRAEYGRLGLGPAAEEKSEPTPVMGIEATSSVTCGAAVSFAVTREGERPCLSDCRRERSDQVFLVSVSVASFLKGEFWCFSTQAL